MVGWTYQRPFELVEWPARTDGGDRPDAHFVVIEDYVTAEDGTGLVHQSPAFGEDDFASCRRNGVAMVNPIDPTGHFADDAPARRRAVLPARQHRPGRATSTERGCSSGTCPTSTATRTAGAATPRCSTTPSRRGTSAPPRSRTRCSGENEKTNWFPDDDQARPLRRLAGEQHRLGALPQPLLGHAAADLALRRGPPDLRRLARRAVRADRHRPVGARPAPAVRRRRHLRLSRLRVRPAQPRAGPRGDRRLVRLRLDAVRPVGLPARRGLGGDARAGLPGRLHLRGDRPDPRLVLHADGGRDAGLRRSRRTATCSAWATSWPRTAARCPSTSATSSSRSR